MASVGAGVLGDPKLGAEAGAASEAGAAPGAGAAGPGGAGLVAAPPAGAGLAVLPLEGLAGVLGSVGMVRLCFCASGMTNGPFWPQAKSAPAQTITINCAIFMCSSIPAPQP